MNERLRKELESRPCKVIEEKKALWHKRLKNEKDPEKLEKLRAEGPEPCEGQWCAIRAKILASF